MPTVKAFAVSELFSSGSEIQAGHQVLLLPRGGQWGGVGAAIRGLAARQHPETLQYGGMIWCQKQGSEPWPPPGALRLSSERAGEFMLARSL